MSRIDDIRNWVAEKVTPSTPTVSSAKQQIPIHASYTDGTYSFGTVWSVPYTGEKSLGELGPAIDYTPDYQQLRVRSWQSYVESDITQTVINRSTIWVIGNGLKLQAAPNMKVLASEGITDFNDDSREKFNETVEARYRTFTNSKMSTWNERTNLLKLEKSAYRISRIGGDCLVVLRYEKGQVKVQLIDGQHLMNPWLNKHEENRIQNGVEIDKRGRQIAFHVKVADENGMPTFKRIVAKQRGTGQTVAFMVYGNEYRCDSVRGMPLVATVLETIKKLERYKEATVGSAEERAKIVYQIVHGVNSTGENPLAKRLAVAMDPDNPGEIAKDVNGKALADTVAVTTNKQTFNMPQDAELKALESKSELHFKEFYDPNFNIICSAVGIPPNVARMLYDDNFSASRAALKDWEHTLRVLRKDFSDQFNSPIYKFWLWTEVMSGRITATGYINAVAAKNNNVTEAFTDTRWVGAQVPHIDPLKEVKAEREKLGPLGANIPLTTAEEATETLGGGDVSDNMAQFNAERNKMTDLGMPVDPPEPVVPGTGEGSGNAGN